MTKLTNEIREVAELCISRNPHLAPANNGHTYSHIRIIKAFEKMVVDAVNENGFTIALTHDMSIAMVGMDLISLNSRLAA